MLQKQDHKTLAQLQALGADENSLLDDSYIYAKGGSRNILLQTLIANLFSDIGRYGFLDLTETTIGFDPVTYTFTLTSVGASWRYLRNGKHNKITGNKTVVLSGTPPAKNRYFISIDADDGTLTASTTTWTLLDTKVPVAIILWDNALTPKYQIAEERHSSLVDRRWHYYAHNTRGAQFVAGGTLSGYTVTPASPIDTDNTFASTITSFMDEDIIHSLSTLSDGDGVNPAYWSFYRSNSTTWNWRQQIMPFNYTPAGYINYDNAGTETQGAANKFYNVYLVYTNFSGAISYATILGRGEFSTLAAAQAENPLTFDWTGFNLSECIVAYQFTFETKNTYTTLGKCRLGAAPKLINVNITTPAISASVFDHNTLSGIQGGQSGEEYHLTAAQWALLIANQFDTPLVLKEVTTPSNPAANYRKMYFKADGKLYKLNSAGAEVEVGGSAGGGGGSALDWNTDSGAPLVVEYGLKGYKFEVITSEDGPPKNPVFVKIPESYVAGAIPKLYIYIWSESTSGTQFIKTNTYLVRPGVEAIDSTANLYTSPNTAAANTGVSKSPQKITLNLADTAGVINGISLAAGQLLRVEMQRGTDTDTDAVRVLVAMELSFI